MYIPDKNYWHVTFKITIHRKTIWFFSCSMLKTSYFTRLAELTANSKSVQVFWVGEAVGSQWASSSPDEQSSSPSHSQAVVRHTFSPVQLKVPVGHSRLPHPSSSSPPAQSGSPSHFHVVAIQRLAVPLWAGHKNSEGAQVPLPKHDYNRGVIVWFRLWAIYLSSQLASSLDVLGETDSNGYIILVKDPSDWLT